MLALNPLLTMEYHADHITKWVQSMISDEYALAKGVALFEGVIRTHEMCTLPSSWQFFSHSCSIAELMAVAFWHSSLNFATLY